MRLAIDIRCLQDKYWTGVADYTWNIIKAFNEKKTLFDLLYYTNSFKQNNQLPTEIRNSNNLISTQYPNKLQNLLLRYNLWQNFDELMVKKDKRPDVFWLPNLHFYQLSKKIKKVLTIHDLSFIHFPQFFSLKKRLWYLASMKRLLKNNLGDFDKIIAVSKHTKDDLISLYPNVEQKIEVIQSGIEDVFFKAPNPLDLGSILQHYNLPRNYLLTVGTIEPRKNHLLLLKAYERIINQHPDFDYDLVIVGTRGWLWRPIIDYWKKMKCTKKIHFIGYVPNNELNSLYAYAKCFLYPSLYEGFGFPPLEAMAAGTPCLVSSASSLPEIVNEAAILLDPWVIDEWVETIISVVNDQELCRKYSAAGKIRAQDFSWNKTTTAMEHLFLSLV
ncbi:MAG: glycosyltransferase family 1 protein [Patescibacteria group bacterium]